MSLPEPFNSVADLLTFTSFQQGAPNGQDSVLDGTFDFNQFTKALKQSRYEIYRKTLRRGNDEFEDDRVEELREAELWLATARLYRNYGERIAVKFPESNLAGVGSVQIGADTPPPSGPGSKGEFWADFMMTRIRNFGLMLLESPSNRFAVEVSRDTGTTAEAYRCLAPQSCFPCENERMNYGCL